MDLLKRMMTFDPSRRITPMEAMSHPFFNSLKQKQYFSDYLTSAQEAFARGTSATPIGNIDDSATNVKANVSLSQIYYILHVHCRTFFLFYIQLVEELLQYC